jgi:DnaJ-class molecular chaperone
MADYYKILGVPRTATKEQIRKAYKKIARESHPDVKPGDKAASERFKQASEAWDVLGDDEKRKQYDQFGEAYKYAGRAGAGPFPGGGGFRGSGPIDLGEIFGGQVDLEDLLGGMFGGRGGKTGGGRRGRQAGPVISKGEDLTAEMTVPFQVAAEGGRHDIAVQRDGKGERLTVKVPPGVSDGSVIRLGGEGTPGLNGGPAGDLLITVRVAPHPYFRREGSDLLLEVPITVAEAGLGAKIDVPTLSEGTVTVTVPPGTSSGTKLRLRGKGVSDPKTKARGDQFVVVKIVIPRSLSDDAQQRLREFDHVAPFMPRAGMW